MQMLRSGKKHQKRVLVLGICKHKHYLERIPLPPKPFQEQFFWCQDCGHMIEWPSPTVLQTNGRRSRIGMQTRIIPAKSVERT